MKVQPYQDRVRRGYPALAKVAALVAVSCAASACQQHQQVMGPPGVPPISDKIVISKDKK